MQKTSAPKLQSLADAEPAAAGAKQKLTFALAGIQTPAAQQPPDLSAAVRAAAALVSSAPFKTLAEANRFIAEAAAALETLQAAGKRAPSPGVAPHTAPSATAHLPILKVSRGPAITRCDFEKLSHSDRNEFFRSGGRIVDHASQATERVL